MIIIKNTKLFFSHPLASWGIGEIYLNNKRYDKAKYYLTKAIELDPDEPIYQYLLGCTYTYTKEIDKAIHHLEKAVHLDDSKDIYWGAAWLGIRI